MVRGVAAPQEKYAWVFIPSDSRLRKSPRVWGTCDCASSLARFAGISPWNSTYEKTWISISSYAYIYYLFSYSRQGPVSQSSCSIFLATIIFSSSSQWICMPSNWRGHATIAKVQTLALALGQSTKHQATLDMIVFLKASSFKAQIILLNLSSKIQSWT